MLAGIRFKCFSEDVWAMLARVSDIYNPEISSFPTFWAVDCEGNRHDFMVYTKVPFCYELSTIPVWDYYKGSKNRKFLEMVDSWIKSNKFRITVIETFGGL